MNPDLLHDITICFCCFFIGLATGLTLLYIVINENPSIEQAQIGEKYQELEKDGWMLCKNPLNQSIPAYNASIPSSLK